MHKIILNATLSYIVVPHKYNLFVSYLPQSTKYTMKIVTAVATFYDLHDVIPRVVKCNVCDGMWMNLCSVFSMNEGISQS